MSEKFHDIYGQKFGLIDKGRAAKRWPNGNKMERAREEARKAGEVDPELTLLEDESRIGPAELAAVEDRLTGSQVASRFDKILRNISAHELAHYFARPVDSRIYKDYYEKVKLPIDLKKVGDQTKSGVYIERPVQFFSDMHLIFDNAVEYFPKENPVYEAAVSLRKLTDRKIKYHFSMQFKGIIKKCRILKRRSTQSLVAESPGVESTLPPTEFSRRQKPTNISVKYVSEIIPVPEGTEDEKYHVNNFTGEVYEVKHRQTAQPIIQHKVAAPPANVDVFDKDTKSVAEPNLEDYTYENVLLMIKNTADARRSRQLRPPRKISPAAVTALSNSKTNNTSGPLVLSEKGAEDLLEELKKPQGIKHDIIRKKTYPLAQSMLQRASLPFHAGGGFVVEDFGVIPFENVLNFHNIDFIFPDGYSCRKTLRLCVVPKKELSHQDISERRDFVMDERTHVDIDFFSRIENRDGYPVFQVMVADSCLVAESHLPNIAWEKAIEETNRVLYAVARKLRRCRALFNRLCVCSEAIPYLEHKEVPSYMIPPGVMAPLWLREIHRKFVLGLYSNENEFAVDIQLCLGENSYISPNPSLLSYFYELFCGWVLNVRDNSVDDFAVGPWDAWMYLRYFDSSSAEDLICTASGQKCAPEDLEACRICENQYHRGLKKLNSQHLCERCLPVQVFVIKDHLQYETFL